MPYAPGVAYRGDQYLFQGIAGLGKDVGQGLQQGIDEAEKLRKQAALNDTMVQHALDTGRMSIDDYNKYTQASWTKKQGIANGVMANIHDDWQRAQFAAEERDKRLQRELSLTIAQMAHAPSKMAFQPIYGQAPEQDPAYADRGLGDMTPSGEPVSTQGPQLGVYGETGTPHFFPWHDVTAMNPDGSAAGTPVVNNDLIPGSSVVTVPGTKNLRIVPKVDAPIGSVMSGEGIPENTYAVGPGGKPITIPKDRRRRLDAAAEDAAAGPTPTPTPTPAPIGQRLQNWLQGAANSGIAGGSTPAPLPSPVAAAAAEAPAYVAPTLAPVSPAALAPNETIRVTKDGRRAVFDAATKTFLRYAD